MTADETRHARELFEQLFGEVSQIGRQADGSTTRLAWTAEAAAAAQWFDRTASRLGLDPQTDANGNRWAWAGMPAPGAVVTGSHLDSVRSGGGYDGALGVVCGLLALHQLRRRGAATAPLAVVSFADEEGGRFDTPTFGSRAMAGSLDLPAILDRRDREGVTLREALTTAGLDPAGVGPDPERLAQIGTLIELHIEQDTLLTERDRPLALGTQILPHGRWRFDLHGEANHAGTTPLAVRRDPMLTLAAAVKAARAAAEAERALATIGKLEVFPNATNAIPERVSLWLDVRAEDAWTVERVVDRIAEEVRADADASGIGVECSRESFVDAVQFSPQLREQVAAILAGIGIEDVPMATGAGHDSGALAHAVPTAMLFVRSATGASHSARELASVEDCVVGIGTLTEVLAALATETAKAVEDG